jgi:hypothetical protein
MTSLQAEPGQDLGQADISAACVDDDKDRYANKDVVEDGDNHSKEDTTAHLRTT